MGIGAAGGGNIIMCLQRPSSVTSAGCGLERRPGRVALTGSERIDENGEGPGCGYESGTKRGKRTESAGTSKFSDRDQHRRMI